MRILQESDGKESTMRLCVLIAVMGAVAVAIASVYLDRDLFETGVLVGAILTPSLGFKAVQKGKE